MRTMASDFDGGRMRARLSFAALSVLLLLGCTDGRPVEPEGPVDELTGEVDRSPQHPVLHAVHVSREAGNARTASVSPEGITLSRTSGTVDFRSGRSDTLVEVVREDGTATPYGRMVRTPEAVYAGMYLGQPEPAWRLIEHDALAAEEATGLLVDGLVLMDRIEEQHGLLPPDSTSSRGRTYRREGPLPTAPDNVLGVVILSFTLDNKARVGSVEYSLPAVREHVFTMTFTDYGAAPPVNVPDV